MTYASRVLRRAEIVLWLTGVSLLGVALGATLFRWHYQTQQERALFASGATPAVTTQLARSPVEPVRATEQAVAATRTYGPPAPASAAATPPPIHEESVTPTPAPAPATVVRKKPAADPTALGRIEIPRIGVRAIVRQGADEKTLARAVGLVPGGARPGETGNTILAGHRDTFFWPLRKIEVNDRIRLVVPPNEYEYRVDSVRIVEPEETSVLQSKGFEELTLVTCYPFRFIGPAPDRFIVSATRVQ